MMNQGAYTQAPPPVDPASAEGQYAVDVTQSQASSYLPSRTGSEVAAWTQQVANYSTENGVVSNSIYPPGQELEPIVRNSHDGLSATSVASSSSLAAASATQGYNNYATYSSATDPYAYGGAGYSGFDNAYQHQPNNSYSQQQPNYSYPQQQPSQSYSQQQPNHAYMPQQEPNHSYSQQQPNHAYMPQQEPNHSYSQQQPTHSYSQPVGAYQNTGAPYQSISSFPNSGSHAGTTSYSATYYNPGDYQTSGGYPSTGYSNQTTSWNDGSYVGYSSQQYPNYSSSATSAYSTGTAPTTPANYQQYYKQWADYYSQPEVTCAPGTEHLSASSASNQGCSVSGAIGGYGTSTSYPQPSSYSQPWRPGSTSYELPSLEHGAANAVDRNSQTTQEAPTVSYQHASSTEPQLKKSLDTKTSYDSFQEQQKIAPQVPNSQYHAANQVSSSYQSPVQSLPSLDTRRVNKLQIPTNPRIASNLALGAPKTDKDGSANLAPANPAYISVSMPKLNEKPNSADSMLKNGTFPKSLRDYVERAFHRCINDTQMAACQSIMKEIITKASADGTLYTRDWDVEPLFPIPESSSNNKDHSQTASTVSSFSYSKRSPSRRAKSRWEPLPEVKAADEPISIGSNAVKYGTRDRKPFYGSESKVDVMSSIKYSLLDQKTHSKSVEKPVKRQCLTDGFSVTGNGDASSDSDQEQSLAGYYSGALALANNPEEKKRRESRSKRFEKVQRSQPEINHFKPKNAGGGNLYSRRASSLMLSKNFDDGGGNAVEDINWDALTVKGTCLEIEKRYLRLTSAPDPSTVRPEEVLEKAVLMVQRSRKNYLYKCDQLKSIRQDLTVQHIRNQLTVKVYETHARFALEAGDLPEYNQCQSQLKTLYAEGIDGSHLEFAAYNLLCVILHSNNRRDLLSSMASLTEEAKQDKAVKHALAVRAAVSSGNYVLFFRLYKSAPNLNYCLLELYVEKMRFKAVTCIARSYRPTVPISYISQILGFSNKTEENESDPDGLGECVEWLKVHGGFLITDNNGEMLLDTKASTSSLYMPEPEDAVAHGDANLAVNDFFTRTPS